MSQEKIDKLYFRALKAVVKERRRSTGQPRLLGEERGLAKQRAQWAAESPVYRAIEEKRKLIAPTPEEVKRRAHRHALKYITQQYRSGWNRGKVAPEHRESMKAHAHNLAKGGSFIPRATADALEAVGMQKKNIAVARIGEDWLKVYRVKGNSSDGEPWFIGPGLGYDIQRLVVFADGESSAYEIAQETWPDSMFGEIISRAKLDKLPEREQEGYEYIQSGSKEGRWGMPSEDIRIWKRPNEFFRNAKQITPHSSLYRLPDGRVIEAR
jgi:hypothetical protein